jgi:hypothetical protein
MIVKIYRVERGKNKRSSGERRRGLALTKIILCHHKNFRESVQKGKEMARTK